MDIAVAIVGFGEAGQAFATAAGWGQSAIAFDIDLARRSQMASAGVRAAPDRRAAVSEADAVLCLVTAGEALAAAQQCAPHIRPGAMWFDMNSVAPETKRQAAAIVEGAGGHYVDVAVLAPVDPARTAVPLLVASPVAAAACEVLARLGFSSLARAGTQVGQASAIKMIRSVMVKGIEALTDEMMAAATAAGVTDAVLASLDASETHKLWTQRAGYNLERMQTHGLRRAEEMTEAARTLLALGVDPVMTRGTIVRQRAAAQADPSEKDAA